MELHLVLLVYLCVIWKHLSEGHLVYCTKFLIFLHKDHIYVTNASQLYTLKIMYSGWSKPNFCFLTKGSYCELPKTWRWVTMPENSLVMGEVVPHCESTTEWGHLASKWGTAMDGNGVHGGPGSKALGSPMALAANSRGRTCCLGAFGSFSNSRRKEAVAGK